MDTYIGDTNIETMYKRSRRAAKDLIFPRCSDCTLVGLHCHRVTGPACWSPQGPSVSYPSDLLWVMGPFGTSGLLK